MRQLEPKGGEPLRVNNLDNLGIELSFSPTSHVLTTLLMRASIISTLTYQGDPRKSYQPDTPIHQPSPLSKRWPPKTPLWTRLSGGRPKQLNLCRESTPIRFSSTLRTHLSLTLHRTTQYCSRKRSITRICFTYFRQGKLSRPD